MCSLSNLFFEPVWKFSSLNKKAILEDRVFLVTNSWTAFEISFRFSVKNFSHGIPKSNLKDRNDFDKKSVWILAWMIQARIAISLSQKPESERNKFSHFKIFRWLREVLFSLDLFSLEIRVSEKDRENLHFFFTERQNWNTLTRLLCQVFFLLLI